MGDPNGLKGKSREIFSGLAETYDRTLDLATLFQDRSWKLWLTRRLEAVPHGIVLDVGCGTLVLEERLEPMGIRFVGVDTSPQMLRVARGKRVRNVGLLAGGDAESLPFQGGVFDCVVSCYVPKYVDPSRFAGEVARVTRPGGAVILYDFARPRGATAPPLQLYIQGGMRLAGAALRMAGRGEAATFNDLPWIIGGTRWDATLPAAMESLGFETKETARLAGGAVFAYWGRKRA